MQDTVRLNRQDYIGGSDIPAILGLSDYKTRYDMILYKSGLLDDNFDGNIYTDYGNALEPKIRGYINQVYNTNYVEDKRIIDDIRCHCDGFNGNSVLEIKTTGKLYKTLDNRKYKAYLAQLLFYMYHFDVERGVLAVYKRDLTSDDFIAKNLQVLEVNLKDYVNMLNTILIQVDKFKTDVEYAKNNILCTPGDFEGGIYERSNFKG